MKAAGVKPKKKPGKRTRSEMKSRISF